MDPFTLILLGAAVVLLVGLGLGIARARVIAIVLAIVGAGTIIGLTAYAGVISRGTSSITIAIGAAALILGALTITLACRRRPLAAPVEGRAGFNVLAILGFVSALLVPVLGVVISHVALSQLKRAPQQGRPLALAGAIVGWILTSLLLIGLSFGMSELLRLLGVTGY